MSVKGHHMTDQEYEVILNHFDRIKFCGNISDPTMHPRFIQFLEKSKNKDVLVATATTHRSYDWYINAFKANKNAIWVFGMDGLPDYSPFYRVNQDGDKMWKIMKLAKEHNMNAIWQFLIFNYNRHQVCEARDMAKSIDIEIDLIQAKRIDGDSVVS